MITQKTIGILTAMSVEYRQVAAMMQDTETIKSGPQEFLVGRVGESRVVLLQCGIGKTNAASGVTNLIMTFRPDCVISTGAAGGIDAKLDVMDVVIGKEVCYHDVYCGDNCDPGQVQGLPRLFTGDERLVSLATSLDTDVHIVPGLICTGDQFVTNRDELDVIKGKFPQGLAVDMESAAIAQVCHLWNVPFLSFRIISDTPGVKAHFEQYLNFWDTMADKSFAVTKEFISRI
ncbi:MAG: 5'-methylthioadenosine/adenosylhomocysteine nucleosidase [Bacteroidaceae bacterium]|nr:5'-methylthioadenosine/adenosylhomocysteine nucleosidase [Bacteroidaceae bacterium]